MILLSQKGSTDIQKIFFLFVDSDFCSLELNDGVSKITNYDSDKYSEVLDAEIRKGLIPLSFDGDVLHLQNKEVRDLFLTLWTKATPADRYNKQEWKKLESILQERGYFRFT